MAISRLRRGIKPYACLAVLLLIAWAGVAQAQTAGQSAGGTRTVSGDILNIENNTVTIKDITGHEVEVKLTPQTKQEDRIKVGDKVEAQVDSNNHAQSIRVRIP